MRLFQIAFVLALLSGGAAGLAGCVVVHHRDGAVTFRAL
jgi:hypothetical protein